MCVILKNTTFLDDNRIQSMKHTRLMWQKVTKLPLIGCGLEFPFVFLFLFYKITYFPITYHYFSWLIIFSSLSRRPSISFLLHALFPLVNNFKVCSTSLSLYIDFGTSVFIL